MVSATGTGPRGRSRSAGAMPRSRGRVRWSGAGPSARRSPSGGPRSAPRIREFPASRTAHTKTRKHEGAKKKTSVSFVVSCLRGFVSGRGGSSKLHRPCPHHLFELGDEVGRRPHPDLRAHLHLHPQAVRRLAGFDFERYLAVTAVSRKDSADGFEGVAIGGLPQMDG